MAASCTVTLISRGREEECRDRLAGRAMGKNSLFVWFFKSYHALAVSPIEEPLITGIVQFGLKPTLGLVKMFLLFYFLFGFCNNDHWIHASNVLLFVHVCFFVSHFEQPGLLYIYFPVQRPMFLPAWSTREQKQSLIGGIGSFSLYLLWACTGRWCGKPIIHLIWNLLWQRRRQQAPGYRLSSRQIGLWNAGQTDGSFSCWGPGWSKALASPLHEWRPDRMGRKACRYTETRGGWRVGAGGGEGGTLLLQNSADVIYVHLQKPQEERTAFQVEIPQRCTSEITPLIYPAMLTGGAGISPPSVLL